jgi:molybdopterin/thiamine biosynthesis adenylyltransferase
MRGFFIVLIDEKQNLVYDSIMITVSLHGMYRTLSKETSFEFEDVGTIAELYLLLEKATGISVREWNKAAVIVNGTTMGSQPGAKLNGGDRIDLFSDASAPHHDEASGSSGEIKGIADVHIAVVGAGALGSFAAIGLMRLGVRHIRIIDNDVFTHENLSRHYLCRPGMLGKYKADICIEELSQNAEGDWEAVKAYINAKNADVLLSGADIVFDCADNIKTKLLLESCCIRKGIPLLHAGANGNFGQAAVIHKKPILASLFLRETRIVNVVVLPQVMAGLQLNLFLKYMQGTYAKDRLYLVDLDTMEISNINY